jgi:hypothetical protein
MGRVSPPEVDMADARYADPIEIEDDDDWVDPSRKFYWNPYSGELSLTFPTSNTKAKGGILADAMGTSPPYDQ